MPNRSTKVTEQVSLKIIYIISIVIKKKSLLVKTRKKNHYLNEVFLFCASSGCYSVYVITTIYYM